MTRMKLNNESYNLIKDGHKTIEVRLNDEKRRAIETSDMIEFTNSETGEMIKTKVINLLHYDTFEELYSSRSPYAFGGNNTQNLIDSIYAFYSKEDEAEYGVLGIELKLEN